MSTPVIAFIALGANLNDPLRQVKLGIEGLARLPASTLLAASSLWRTAPVGVEGQPDFINAVVKLETRLPALDLLAALQAMELQAGRQRDEAVPMAPRTLDLDLLLYGNASIDTPELSLPHPRMHARAFVLAPLCELAPQLDLPGHGRIADCLARVLARGDQVLHPV